MAKGKVETAVPDAPSVAEAKKELEAASKKQKSAQQAADKAESAANKSDLTSAQQKAEDARQAAAEADAGARKASDDLRQARDNALLERKIGRKLREGEYARRINGDKNSLTRMENVELCSGEILKLEEESGRHVTEEELHAFDEAAEQKHPKS